MKQSFKTIGLIGKYGDPGISETLMLINDDLCKRGLDVLLDQDSTLPKVYLGKPLFSARI